MRKQRIDTIKPLISRLAPTSVVKAAGPALPLYLFVGNWLAEEFQRTGREYVVATAKEVAEELGVTYRNVEYWKAKLRDAGLMQSRRRGLATEFRMPRLLKELQAAEVEFNRSVDRQVNHIINGIIAQAKVA